MKGSGSQFFSIARKITSLSELIASRSADVSLRHFEIDPIS
jgi:hypothetical protein